jgi:hypothetical protein
MTGLRHSDTGDGGMEPDTTGPRPADTRHNDTADSGVEPDTSGPTAHRDPAR